MLEEALRPPRQSFLLGPSTVFCVAARRPRFETQKACLPRPIQLNQAGNSSVTAVDTLDNRASYEQRI